MHTHKNIIYILRLLSLSGIRVTSIKIDPYLNVDAGTYSFQCDVIVMMMMMMMMMTTTMTMTMKSDDDDDDDDGDASVAAAADDDDDVYYRFVCIASSLISMFDDC